jgi:hypothetical protein
VKMPLVKFPQLRLGEVDCAAVSRATSSAPSSASMRKLRLPPVKFLHLPSELLHQADQSFHIAKISH